MRRFEILLLVLALSPAGFCAAPLQGLATSSATYSKIAEGSLHVPASGVIKVAFLVSDGTTLIDVAGPMQTFLQVTTPLGRFETYTVSATKDPTDAHGLTVVPEYTFETAPDPDIVVIGAQSVGAKQGDLSGTLPYLDYVRRMANADKLMLSVCTGASILAKAGLLDGLYATTHHDYVDPLQKRYPSIHWLADKAYVHSAPRIYTAGGETSGFELALHIVQLYFGHKTAVETARSMEYRGPAWQT